MQKYRIKKIYRLETRMTTLITDDQTNIYRYEEAANITENNIILKLIFLRIIIPKFMIIIPCKNEHV